MTIPGFTPIAEADIDSAETPTRFTLQDNFTMTRGRHTWKAGFEIRPTRFANRRRGDGNNIAYANINDFLNNRLNSAQVSAEQYMNGVRKNVFGAFLQDEWKVQRDLTLNLGVRYDYFGVLSEDYKRQYPFDLETCGGFCPNGSAAAFPDRTNVSPRLSIAWAPRQLGGRTVIRTGFGMFYGEGQLGNQLSPFENGTSRTLLSSADFPGLSYPIRAVSCPRGKPEQCSARFPTRP
ncbi:MAG: TonB-dependent receptor [Acidobacteriota bacterium]